MNIGELFVKVRADDADFKKELTQSAEQAGDAAGEAGGKKMSQRIGDTLKKHSTLIATTAGAGLGAFVAGSAQEFAKFETSMNEVFTLLPGISEDAMSQMSSQVKDFSNEFGKLPDEVVPALYQSLSAGVPQDNVFAFLETANKLAVGGVAETGEAVAVLAAITKGYGDTSQEATDKVSDLIFTTVKLGTTTVPELAASLGKAVPQAAALNVAQEELFASAAALTGVTGNTAEVSTQLKSIFTSLLNPTAEMAKGLGELGYESGAAAIESLGLQGTLQALEGVTDGNTAQFAKMLGSSEALTAGLAITGTRADAVSDNLAAMQDAAGATDDAFGQMTKGVQHQANLIGARIKTLALGIGEFIAPVGPILTAFGPTFGKALGGAFGAGFGFLATKIPALMGPVITKILAVMTGAQLTQGVSSAMTGAFSGVGAKVGGVVGGRFGAAFKVAGVLAIAGLWLEVFNQFLKFNRDVEQAQADLQDKAVAAGSQSGNEAIDNLDNLSAKLGELQGLDRVLGDTFGGEQEILGLRNLAIAIGNESDLTAEEITRAGEVLAAAAHEARARGNENAGQLIDEVAKTVAAKKPVIRDAVEGAVGDGVTEGLTEAEKAQAEQDAIVQDLVDRGIISPMEDELAAGTEVAVDEAFAALPDVIDAGMDALRGGSSITDAFSGLGDDAKAALIEAVRKGADINEAFADLPAEMRAALEPIVPVMRDTIRAANKEARHEAALTGVSIRDGIKSSKDVVKTAMQDLLFAMTHPMRGLKAIAKVEGALTSKRMRDGLKSNDPLIKRQAELSRAQLVEQWELMTGESWDYGKGTAANLAGGIRERRKNVRQSARETSAAATTEFAAVPPQAWQSGAKTARSFAGGITSFIDDVVAAAQKAAQAVADNTKPGSPTKTGPLSKDGGIEAWGGRLQEQLAAGLSDGRMDVPKALGLNAIDSSRRRLASAASFSGGGGVGGNQTFNIETHGLPMRSRTPAEVSQQVRRVARLGLVEMPGRTTKFDVSDA